MVESLTETNFKLEEKIQEVEEEKADLVNIIDHDGSLALCTMKY